MSISKMPEEEVAMVFRGDLYMAGFRVSKGVCMV